MDAIYRENPHFRLFVESDVLHPSQWGQYLEADVLYRALVVRGIAMRRSPRSPPEIRPARDREAGLRAPCEAGPAFYESRNLLSWQRFRLREAFVVGRFRVVSGLVREFVLFLKEDRTWWLAPIFVALLGLGVFIIFAQGSALAPFIYALF